MIKKDKNLGFLAAVGTGIKFGIQCTKESVGHILAADTVYAMMGDSMSNAWLKTLRDDYVNLQEFYLTTESRDQAYHKMIDVIVEEVGLGKYVCAVFYGHPGVFVYPSHEAIRIVRESGHDAVMCPSVSAQDCLYADLGFDPGVTGCQSYEATDFYYNDRKIDTSAALILWQIGVVGDLSFSTYDVDEHKLSRFVKLLSGIYSKSHKVAVYQASIFPTIPSKIQWFELERLMEAEINQVSTLYIPPISEPVQRKQL